MESQNDDDKFLQRDIDSDITHDRISRSQCRIEEHTKIFASMCPDEILDHYDDYETRVYQVTLMLGDVSGFTDLTEKYTRTGKGGPSKLTETLNSYIGAMVQEILSHNGDVLKFSGDAFVVMWKLQEGKIMRDLATEAMQTACMIQKHFGTYDTDVGVTLKVKLAIASGKIYFTSIGDPETMSYYIITGNPVWDVKFAEGLCRGGDILVAPSSWQWVNPNEYIHETLPDGIHTLITGCSSMWYDAKSDDVLDSDDENGSLKKIVPEGSNDSEIFRITQRKLQATTLSMSLSDNSITQVALAQVDYSLRPKVIKMAKAQMKSALKSYLLRPVVRSVEMNEPLEFLTEMRQVVIVFINVITLNIGKLTLIALVDAAYKLVCKIVGRMHGCVNKTSLFDKDLMFLCIFGLRGDKHEFESQIGLRCATKVREGLTAMKNVQSVTVGVTTGVTYCGVVGHILRREYTVIGLSVNKAARLMIAYRDKVICDRESFLHSRLEARHFILQEPKYLKGITNIGPVYEFQEQSTYSASDLVWNKYPLLGRTNEIKIFRKMLATLIEYSNLDKRYTFARPECNTLIIKGEPRIGKTRLLDEITQNIPAGVPCNYVTLVTDDAKTPYSLIHLIFSMPLGFSLTSTHKERENKLLARLGRVSQPHYLCALNQPFNVRFSITNRYKALIELQKRKVLRKFLMKLMKGCFNQLWVVIISDAEYSDVESLLLFDLLTNRDRILFVISIGRKLTAEYRLYPTLLNRAKVIELTGIDKWYHAGLACQILNVNGIPAQLEKLIQERSAGVPGWIESYLISLLQAGGLVILNITKREADLMGYVLPDIRMLKRFVSQTLLISTDTPKRRTDRWQMYRSSYKDSITTQRDVKSGQFRQSEIETTGDETTIAVCKLTDKFSLEQIDGDFTMDVMIIKLIDSLTSLDQFLLKCASVLGEIVNRYMLENLMEPTTKREIGLEELEDLPKYASCGLMRFKMSMFRETTYRLLTERQKMKLHSEALKYLQQHTRRCFSCGEGEFAKLLGKSATQVDRQKRLTTIDEIVSGVAFRLAASNANRERQKEQMLASCLNVCRNVERKPTYTFSNLDFTNCQCHLILMTVYTQILDHCRGFGNTDMTLTAILEFVEICLASYNIPQARTLLNECETLLHKIIQSSEDELIAFPYLTGKIQTLEGRCYLESGLITEAERALQEALDSLGYTFPRLDLLIDVKSMIQFEKLRLKLSWFKNWKSPVEVEEYTVNYMEQLAECLAQMFDLFRTKGMQKHARLAALWGLNAALTSKKNFVVRCVAFTNMLITAHMFQNRNIIASLENESIHLCNENQGFHEYQEFKIIAELYAGIFASRWIRGQIRKAIGIGFVCIRMANTIGSTFLKLLVLPRVAHLLMMACRHAEAVTQLRVLEFVSQDDLDKSGQTWYYALCADVHLDTGLTVLSFRKCEEYFLREGKTMISLRDPEARKRYFTSMWLWCIRTEQWEASMLWNNRNTDDEIMTDEDKVAATITAMKRLEGLLILYVHKVNSRNTNASITMMEINETFNRIGKISKIVEIAIPRYILLKAYYYMIKSRKTSAMKLLRRVQKLCLKVENRMIYEWALHCEQAWSGTLSSIQEDMWKEGFNNSFSDEWDEVNANDTKMVPFTFPLPRYPS